MKNIGRYLQAKDVAMRNAGYKCQRCGSMKRLTGHHIVPKSVDRSLRDEPSNIEIMCFDCHAEHERKVNKILRNLKHERG